jgi:hypothetical protein
LLWHVNIESPVGHLSVDGVVSVEDSLLELVWCSRGSGELACWCSRARPEVWTVGKGGVGSISVHLPLIRV